MIMCGTCGKEKPEDIYDDITWMDWLRLMNYFLHELLEEEITNDTYEDMTSALMTLKPMEGRNEIKSEEKNRHK